MNYKIINIKNLSNYENVWKSLLVESKFFWFFNNLEYYKFHHQYLKEKKILFKDETFFVEKDNKIISLVVLLINKEGKKIYSSYLNRPLPFPLLSDEVINKQDCYDFIFQTIDLICKRNKVGKISFSLNNNQKNKIYPKIFYNCIKKFSYIDNSFKSHLLDLNMKKFGFRKSYLQIINKIFKNYEVKIVDKNNLNDYHIKEYMSIHTKASGSIIRSFKTYKIQFDEIKNNNGFLINVHEKIKSKIIGSLMVFHDKKSAYYASVAVLPEESKNYINHLMKKYAIDYLIRLDVKEYELGRVFASSNYNYIVNEKEIQISFFKDGWTRENYKTNYVAEKFFIKEDFEDEINSKVKRLKKFFNL